MKNFLAGLAAFLFAGKLFAADVGENFDLANRLYAQGKFPEAAEAYKKILQAGVQSPALLFNAGNAEFKSGHLGQAIAAYRQAEMLAPRDDAIRANLAFARQQVQGLTTRPARWQGWFNVLSLNEWTLLAALAFWIAVGLFAVRQWRPALAARLRGLTRGAVIVMVFFLAVLGLQAATYFSRTTAVILSAETTARTGPFDEAQSVFTARDGAELPVVGTHEDWVQVSDGAGRTGWLNRKQVVILPGT